ncbi:hypothetical protein DFH28DRAFT_877593 [Melampsora americana]|nr:hypothetical protein DFH28DRAFT_877593 [Melampsora americana]
MDPHNSHLQQFPHQPFQPMHQNHHQPHQPFDSIHPAHRPVGPIDQGHQDISLQCFDSMHQNYQARGHQPHQDQARGHQPHQDQARGHQPHQDQARHQAHQDQARHQPYQDQARHQPYQPFTPMHQGISQPFENTHDVFSYDQVPRTISYNNHQKDRSNQSISDPSPLPQSTFNTTQIESHSFQHENQANSRQAPSQTSALNSQSTKSKAQQGKKKVAPIPKDSAESTHNILNGFLPKSSYNSELELDSKGPSAEELMASKSLDQLRVSAERFGKSTLSGDDQIHFRNLQNELSKALAVNCIGRGVKPSAVEVYLSLTSTQLFCCYRGQRKPFRDSSSWQGFVQAPESRAIYKEHGGVKSGLAVKAIKAEYDKLTKEEKDTYKPKPKLETIIDQAEQERDTTNNEAGVLSSRTDNAGQATDTSDFSIRAKARSFAEDQDVVIKWVQLVNTQMHRLAETYHIEGFVMLVSTHLSCGALQLVRATPAALKWHETTKRLKPQDNCIANLQSYVLGRKVGLQDSSDDDKSIKSQARQQLGQRLAEITKQQHTKWPWKNCVSTLESWGYTIRLLPTACSKIEWITGQKGSNGLTNSQARMILKDLEMDLIRLAPLANPLVPPDSSDLPSSRKRPRTGTSDLEEEEGPEENVS